MSTVKTFFRIFSVVSLMLVFPLQSRAQFELNKLNLILDWQIGSSLSTDFADNLSCSGANFELSYAVAPHWEAGLFLGFHTNRDYIGRQTIAISPTESLNTDQLRSAYQLPFGLVCNYVFIETGYLNPYVGVKLGTSFARYTTYYGVGGYQDESWGFYVAPEIGVRIHPCKYTKWGIHIAGYYNYATNQTATLTHDVEGQSNLGFRVGLCF